MQGAEVPKTINFFFEKNYTYLGIISLKNIKIKDAEITKRIISNKSRIIFILKNIASITNSDHVMN